MSTFPEIAPGWNIQPLGKACEIIMGQAPKGSSYNEKGVGIALIAGAADLGFKSPVPKKWTDSPTKIGQKGDIILCVRATIGDLNWADKKYCYGRGVAGIRTNSKYDPDFIWFWLMACRDHLLSLARGATFKQISKFDIANLAIPDLKISEQRRIVTRIKECLGRVDEIEKLRSEGKNDIKILTSSLYEFFDENCKWAKKNIANLVNATRNGKSIKQENKNSTGFVLSLKSVHDISLNFEHKKKINLNEKNAEQYKIIDGDVFVSRSNTRELVGLASVATESPEGIIFPDLLIKLEPKKELIRSRFLAYALRSPESRAQIKDRAVGTSQSMVKISGQRLKEISIPVPPLDVQDKLITRFDKLHDLSSTILSDFQSQNLGSLRQAILRKAFAGEL